MTQQNWTMTILAAVLCLALATPGLADTYYWRLSSDSTGYTGQWTDGVNWNAATGPQAGDTANLTGNDVTDGTVIYVDSAVPDLAAMQLRNRGFVLEVREGGSLTTAAVTYSSQYDEGGCAISVQGGSLTMAVVRRRRQHGSGNGFLPERLVGNAESDRLYQQQGN